jgi:L-fuculose-phosphate aldolase
MTLSPVPYSDRNRPVNLPTVPADESSLRALICHIGRLMHQAGYIEGASGTITARLDAGHFLATPPGLAKGFLQPDQLIIIDLEGKRVSPISDKAPNLPLNDELSIHLECYRQRLDVHGVVYAQPPTAIALTIAGVSMRTCVLPDAVVVLGVVPTAAYSTPASIENLDAVRALIAQHDALLLAYSGSITVGQDVWQAFLRLETLEHAATVLHKTAQLGPIVPLSPEQVTALLEKRRQLGYWRAGDDERFCELCGAC